MEFAISKTLLLVFALLMYVVCILRMRRNPLSCSVILHQNLGVILHRENARAALRRLGTQDTEQWAALLQSATTLQSTTDDFA